MLTLNSASPEAKKLRQEIQELKTEDLGLVRWETSWNRPSLSNRYFEAYLARPRGAQGPFSFLVKALRPRYCGAAVGPALVERERSLGSIDCRRLLPVVDCAYPRRVSETRATRGFIVSPLFRGRTLAQAARKNGAFDSKTLDGIADALREIVAELERRAWTLTSLSAEQILVSGGARNVTLLDYSTAYRFANVSLLTETFACRETCDVSFDPKYLLTPNAFYRPDLARGDAERVVDGFLRTLLQKERL